MTVKAHAHIVRLGRRHTGPGAYSERDDYSSHSHEINDQGRLMPAKVLEDWHTHPTPRPRQTSNTLTVVASTDRDNDTSGRAANPWLVGDST